MMPKIDLEKLSEALTPDELELVRGIVANQGKNKGCLRASKPEITYITVKIEPAHSFTTTTGNTYHVPDREVKGPEAKSGKSAYIWRMVAFYVSPIHQHHCMPMTADWDLPGQWGDEQKQLIADMDRIVDLIINTIDPAKWHGVQRWAGVL